MEMPNRWASCVQRVEVNTEPLSDVMTSGRPNLEIHVSTRADTQESVEASDIGTASGHLVERSIMENMYRQFWEMGKGPTMST